MNHFTRKQNIGSKEIIELYDKKKKKLKNKLSLGEGVLGLRGAKILKFA